MAAIRLVALAALGLGCGSTRPRPPLHHQATGDDITLYRDVAVIRQRVDVDVPATPATIEIQVGAGVTADQLSLLDRGGLTITGIHAATAAPETATPADDETHDEEADLAFDDALFGDEDPDAFDGETPPPEPHVPAKRTGAGWRTAKPTRVRLDVSAPRPGRYTVVLGYATPRVRWEVAYTMTAAAARDHGELSGAIAIHNDTGIRLRAATARVVDAELVPWRSKTAEHLAAELVGGVRSSTAPATPRELGTVQLGDGETRVVLLRDAHRRLRSVLVYDPIGTKLDNPSASPLRDETLGVRPAASPRVTESFEIARDARESAGLPAGPVRLLERKPDGALVVLGESRLFDAATRVSDVDTIAVGTAEDVTGARERRELTIDLEGRRIVEEFVITLDNKRAHPVEVLVREHLYRGQNWALAYYSVRDAAKEGPQQISLREQVPAGASARIRYVVVYTWGQ